MANKKIIVTEELKELNPDLLKDVNVGDKTDVIPELVLKKEDNNTQNNQGATGNTNTGAVNKEDKNVVPEGMVQISKEQLDTIMGQLKMLTEVADKGRVLNYETANAAKGKKIMKAQLSIIGEGYLVGWRTMKDELIKHPTSGLVIGETQEYELLVLLKDDTIQKVTVNGYPAFSNSRYNERVEVEIIGKEEDFDGNVKFNVKLPDGRVTKLAGAFIN